MKIAHFSDLHYCPEHLDEVQKCFGRAAQLAIEKNSDIAVISGDLFDHRIELHEPSVTLLLGTVSTLASFMPVLILQGTFSHDQPGSLDVFKTMGGEFPVHVADKIQQVAYSRFNRSWQTSKEFAFDDIDTVIEPSIIFSCLPPVNKGFIAAAAGAENAAHAAGEYVYDLMKGFGVINQQARNNYIPTAVVSHGTVNGCVTEHGVPMHGNDHEFTTGSLFASKATACMLGHIHQHQSWIEHTTGQIIAYPGSIGRLHFGEMSDKGFLIWDVCERVCEFSFITTPAKRLVEIEFDGVPDMDELKRQASEAGDAHVRVRWTVDEEHRGSIDKKAIEALFADVGTLKLEGRIKPVQRQRAAGISQAHSVTDKLEKWCVTTGAPVDALRNRLEMLRVSDPDKIAKATMNLAPVVSSMEGTS